MKRTRLDPHAEILGLIPTDRRRNKMTLEALDGERKELRRFTVTAIEGEKPDGTSQRVRSEYVEESWMPYLGPVAIMFARKIDMILSTEHKWAIDVPKWSEQMGITPDDLIAACHRLVRYGHAHWGDRDPMLLVRRHWPLVPDAIKTPLHRRVLTGLPDIEVTA